LEAVDDDDLIALADPDDEDGDGISGRIKWVPGTDTLADIAGFGDAGGGARLRLHDTDDDGVPDAYIGRFGRKASNISLLHQAVSAYHQDMGITSDFATRDPVNPLEGTAASDVAPDPEVTSETLFAVAFYLQTLRAPVQRDPGSVVRGQGLFTEVGCAVCHVETLTTGAAAIGPLRNQEFHPYTDLLLHDMGEELNDGYAEGSAQAGEWRTLPLWGLGLAADFQGGTPFLLHDGRATSIGEAIDYHGGEGSASRDAFKALSTVEQGQVIAFLESL
jgi:CxxC motif-containing protein (DUF1111 family)